MAGGKKQARLLTEEPIRHRQPVGYGPVGYGPVTTNAGPAASGS